jgi:hypothetical protein
VRVALSDTAPLYRDAPEAREVRASSQVMIEAFLREALPASSQTVRTPQSASSAGRRRERFPDPAALQQHTGVAAPPEHTRRFADAGPRSGHSLSPGRGALTICALELSRYVAKPRTVR